MSPRVLFFNICLFLIFTLTSPFVYGVLDEDTVFKGRILGLSDTKRTILVNRGSEHGLAKDQHAKISLPSGMVARAVVVKISPTRSVWSIYRFISQDDIKRQSVYRFKISSPVKLTKDESKALGALADKVDKKKEVVPPEPESLKAQNKVRKSIISAEHVISQFDHVDYSNLNESSLKQKKLSDDIDWSGLNGKKDSENFDSSLDYTKLK